MLGRMEIASSTGELVRLRSKSATLLLAHLLLHQGKFVSRFTLEELLWPESDGDRQAQNLRRAISDLRAVLESDAIRGSVIETQRDIVRVAEQGICCDTLRFLNLTEHGLNENDVDALAEALLLYSGPLLPHEEADWIYPIRLDFEERFAHAVERLCGSRIANGRAQESVRIARSALLSAPHRQEIHTSLIIGYRQLGLEDEAIRQFEDLEKMLDDMWGEVPSKAARAALEGPIAHISHSQPSVGSSTPSVVSDTDSTGGALPLHSHFYVRREADHLVEKALSRQESVILIQGPRQVGKSSLLARMLAHARGSDSSVVLLDLQSMGERQLGEDEMFYRGFAHQMARQLESKSNIQSIWNSWLGVNLNLDAVVGELLSEVKGHVVLAIDEADRIFGRSYANDFFGLLRSWHNRRALDPDGPWSKLTLMIAYATEAHLFITDLNQSPFNVGIRLPIRDFSMEEVEELAGRYSIDSEEQISGVFRTTNGHPFLARRALSFLSQGRTVSELESSCALPDGPFGDHLQAMLGSILHDPMVVPEVKRLLADGACEHAISRYRLMAAGVLAPDAGTQSVFRVPAYACYLRRELT